MSFYQNKVSEREDTRIAEGSHYNCRIKPATVTINNDRVYVSSESFFSSLPDTVVLLSVKKTKLHLPRPPSVCPPPLSGHCWFNPGGQQAGLTAPRHCHVIYGVLWEWRGDDHSDLTPAALSATHQKSRQRSDLSSCSDLNPEPWPRWMQLVVVVGFGGSSSTDSRW